MRATRGPARRRPAVLAVVSLVFATLQLLVGPSASAGTDWLTTVNAYRSAAGLSTVTENPSLDAGAARHSHYMAANNVLTHVEDPNNPYYTSEGAAAGRTSVLYAGLTGVAAVNGWMSAPFHAAPILEPRAASMGYADEGRYATLVTFGDLSAPDAPASAYPLVWPAAGSTITATTYGGAESPDPRSGCGQEYQRVPDGLAMVVWGRDANGAPDVLSQVSLTLDDGTVVAVCVGGRFDDRQAVVVRDPLLGGRGYTLSFGVNGSQRTITFATAQHPTSTNLTDARADGTDPDGSWTGPSSRITAVAAARVGGFQPGEDVSLQGTLALQWRPADGGGSWQDVATGPVTGDGQSVQLAGSTPQRPQLRVQFRPRAGDVGAASESAVSTLVAAAPPPQPSPSPSAGPSPTSSPTATPTPSPGDRGPTVTTTPPPTMAPLPVPTGCTVRSLRARTRTQTVVLACHGLGGHPGRLLLQTYVRHRWTTVGAGAIPLRDGSGTWSFHVVLPVRQPVRALVQRSGRTLSTSLGHVGR